MIPSYRSQNWYGTIKEHSECFYSSRISFRHPSLNEIYHDRDLRESGLGASGRFSREIAEKEYNEPEVRYLFNKCQTFIISLDTVEDILACGA